MSLRSASRSAPRSRTGTIGLSRLAELVRPGGTLAVLGLAASSAVDHDLAVVAVPADTAVGSWKAFRGRGGKLDQQIVIAGETAAMGPR